MSDVQTQAVPQEVAAPAAPTIGIADLQNAVKIIDYACDQGAFKGWQVIEQVVSVREKLVAFLAAAAPATPAEAPAAEVVDAKPKAKPVSRTTTKPKAAKK